VLPQGWPAPLWPSDNPYSQAKALLGRELFFDFDLSRDRTVSCGWCHAPVTAFADNHHTAFSTGVEHRPTRRNTPTLANVVFAEILMLDGRASSLESQALLPLFDPDEMDMTGAGIVARVREDTVYARLFREAYGTESVTIEGVARALATYQRTLISYRAPYDLWSAGDGDALTPGSVRGAALFTGDKAGCAACHIPPLFTDGLFHNTGLDSATTDPGRAHVTGAAIDAGRFKTPTLRNVVITAPYMHDGRLNTLAEVIGHYNDGGRPHPNRDARMRPLGLTPQEVDDLAEFLESLTDPDFSLSPWR
jgi:cytochrome c peroxidase